MKVMVMVMVMRSGWGGGRGWGVKVVVGGVVREVLGGGKKIWYVCDYFLMMGFFPHLFPLKSRGGEGRGGCFDDGWLWKC